jgi:hypothetical protein
MSYRRQNLLGDSLDNLREFTLRELEAIERGFSVFDFARLKKWHAEPTRYFDGMVVYADGSNWDPGSGEGIYARYGGTWNKL